MNIGTAFAALVVGFMKLNLVQFISISFVIGWVAGQVIKSPYEVCLGLGFLGAFIAGYINNAHGELWKLLKRKDTDK